MITVINNFHLRKWVFKNSGISLRIKIVIRPDSHIQNRPTSVSTTTATWTLLMIRTTEGKKKRKNRNVWRNHQNDAIKRSWSLKSVLNCKNKQSALSRQKRTKSKRKPDACVAKIIKKWNKKEVKKNGRKRKALTLRP